MNDGQKRKSIDNKKIFLAAAVVIIAAVLIVFMLQFKKSRDEKHLIEEGVAYLTKLENQDMKEIKDNIKRTRSVMSLELADTDESAIWGAMSTAVLCGDSRGVGFSYHEFMPESNVFAKGGGKITDIPEYLNQIAAINPESVFLCYGLNDIGIGLWPTGEEYAQEYEKHVESIYERVPDTTVYVNSILPAIGVGLEADADYPRIGEYNEALEAMCEEHGWAFIDNDVLAEEHADLYQPDGLHVDKSFYKYWAANMLTEVED